LPEKKAAARAPILGGGNDENIGVGKKKGGGALTEKKTTEQRRGGAVFLKADLGGLSVRSRIRGNPETAKAQEQFCRREKRKGRAQPPTKEGGKNKTPTSKRGATCRRRGKGKTRRLQSDERQ